VIKAFLAPKSHKLNDKTNKLIKELSFIVGKGSLFFY